MKAKHVEKKWGYETWLANNEKEDYCGKILHINAGCSSSMHYHMDKHETFYVREGQLQVILIDTEQGRESHHMVLENCTFEIERGQPHQLIAYGGNDVEFIEISTFHKDSDSKRIHR
jgi:mannose-6-phosphate isomerase-like protein (cupin superfamily)